MNAFRVLGERCLYAYTYAYSLHNPLCPGLCGLCLHNVMNKLQGLHVTVPENEQVMGRWGVSGQVAMESQSLLIA